MNAAAERFAAELRATSDTYHTRQIDHETFHARQTATWDAIRDAGLDEDVLALLGGKRS